MIQAGVFRKAPDASLITVTLQPGTGQPPPPTDPPVTNPPVTSLPVTNPPVTNPPVTNPPFTVKPPVTNPPVTTTAGGVPPTRTVATTTSTKNFPPTRTNKGDTTTTTTTVSTTTTAVLPTGNNIGGNTNLADAGGVIKGPVTQLTIPVIIVIAFAGIALVLLTVLAVIGKFTPMVDEIRRSKFFFLYFFCYNIYIYINLYTY